MDERKKILTTVSICHAFNDGAVVIIPILFPIFKVLFDLSYTDIGIITGGGLLITLITQIIIGRLSDKKNKKLLLSIGIVLICTTFMLFTFITGFLTLLLIFFLHRFSTSFFHPIGIAWVSKIYKRDKLDWAMGTQSALGDFGAFIAILTIPFLAEIRNWIYPFYIWTVIGSICLLSVILLTIDLKEDTNIDHIVKKNNLTNVLFEDWNSIKKTKMFLPALIGSGLTWSVILNYLPLLLSEKTSLSISMIGVIVSIWLGIGTIVCFFYGKIALIMGRKKIIILSYITIGVMCIFLSIFTNLFVLLIIIIILGFATFLTFPALFSFISEIADEKKVGKTFGYVLTIELGSGTLVLYISGITSDIWGIWTPFVILGVICFLSLIPFLKIFSKKTFYIYKKKKIFCDNFKEIFCIKEAMKQDIISMLDVRDDLEKIIDLGIDLKRRSKSGISIELLKGKTLGMIFEKSSTRTRVSFEVGMNKLGGHAIFLSKNDIQLGRGETIQDTALVLSRYVDLIMFRATRNEAMKELSKYANVPVISGLDNKEHPCQVIADLMTIKEHKGKLSDLKFVYVGDGANNMSHSYILGCAIAKMYCKVVAPRKYWPDEYFLKEAEKLDGRIEIIDKVGECTKNADVVATDTWVSMGDETQKERRIKEFQGYTIDKKLMSFAKKDAVFLHCLPAYYGYEVTKDVAYGSQSLIFDEAENRLWAQMAIMVNLCNKNKN